MGMVDESRINFSNFCSVIEVASQHLMEQTTEANRALVLNMSADGIAPIVVNEERILVNAIRLTLVASISDTSAEITFSSLLHDVFGVNLDDLTAEVDMVLQEVLVDELTEKNLSSTEEYVQRVSELKIFCLLFYRNSVTF